MDIYQGENMKKGSIPIIAIVMLLIGIGVLVSFIVRANSIANPDGTATPGCKARELPAAIAGSVTIRKDSFIIGNTFSLTKINTLNLNYLGLFSEEGNLNLILKRSDGKIIATDSRKVEFGLNPFGMEEKVPFELKFNTMDYNCDNLVDDFNAMLIIKFTDQTGKITEQSKTVRISGGEVQ
jgi:hypothetical protein